jgi:hypothetical protein
MKNALFLTQAASLRPFADVRNAMAARGELGRAGFYVADSSYYADYRRARPDFEASNDVVKEWEILAQARAARPDRARIAELERRYGETLWNAVVSDRRLYLGVKAVREQDDATRYSHDELLSILLTAADAVEGLFDRVRPDLVAGFICVTVGEYLSYLIARQRGVPFINIRPTRIKNYFYGGEDVFEPSASLDRAYRRLRAGGVPERSLAAARDILQKVRASHAMYEGAVPLPQQAADSAAVEVESRPAEGLAQRLKRMAHETWDYNFGALAADNHRAPRLVANWFNRIKKPWRVKSMALALERHYVRDLSTLGERGYAFFPLHKEPEVTMLVYSRPWLNQIEVVRNIARSLPAGMTLLVKEHPVAVGYRPLSYYRRLLEIPNVALAAPDLTSREVLRHAKLVAIISGSIGLEAIMLKIPVVALGNVPFAFLPETMIRTVKSPHEMHRDIMTLLNEHDHDEGALEAFVAATALNSVAVDFYSVLLKRRGVYRPQAGSEGNDYAAQIERLTDYLLSRQAAMSRPETRPMLKTL